jgi:hypothetical protein
VLEQNLILDLGGYLYANPLDDELVAGECKWPTGSDVLGTLANRAELVCGGASRTLLFLFSKTGFTDECKADALRLGNVRLVTVDEMFEL